MKPVRRESTAKSVVHGRPPSGGARVEKSVKRPEPSHSLYSTSTESSDQVQGAHNDLDRCARVLSEILDNDRGILDAIKKKARRCVGPRGTVTSKAPCKKKVSSHARRRRSGEPSSGVWSSTPQRRSPLLPAASVAATLPSATACVTGTSAQTCSGSGRPYPLPNTSSSVPPSCVAEGESENRTGLAVATMSALDSPARRIKLMKRNEVRRVQLSEPPHAVAMAAGSTAGASVDTPHAGVTLPLPATELYSKGVRKDRRRPAATSLSAERGFSRRAAGSSCSNSSSASASEADTLRGVHLENSSEFGVPPVFSTGAPRVASKQSGFLGSLTAERCRQLHSATVARPVAVPNPAIGWEREPLSRAQTTVGRGLGPYDATPCAAHTGTSTAATASAFPTDAATYALAATRCDVSPSGTAQRSRPACDDTTTDIRLAGELQKPPDSITCDSDESKDETLITSVLDAAGESPSREVPLSSSPATEACRFRLRYLAREICMSTKNSDLKDLAAELEKTADLLLQARPRCSDREGPPSALFAENMLLQKKLKLFEARLASAKATACDQADMKCAAYELQVAKLEGLIAQLERTIADERRLLQQAADQTVEQQKLVADLQSERSQMIHALAFKDQLCAKLRRQQEAAETQYTARIGELERGLSTQKSRLLDCTDELCESRAAVDCLVNCTKAAYELLSRLTESVDALILDGALKKTLQVQLADIRCHLLRGCSDQFLPTAASVPKVAGNGRSFESRVRFHAGEITASRQTVQPMLGLDAAISRLGGDAAKLQSSSSSGDVRVDDAERSRALLGRTLRAPAASTLSSTAYQPGSLSLPPARMPLPSRDLLAAVSQCSRDDGAELGNPPLERSSSAPANTSNGYCSNQVASDTADILPSSDLSTTRYSVTDYFRKYRPLLSDEVTCPSPSARPMPPVSATQDEISDGVPSLTTAVPQTLPCAESVSRKLPCVAVRVAGTAAQIDLPAKRLGCSSPRLNLSEISEPEAAEAGCNRMPSGSPVPCVAGSAANGLSRSQSQSFAGTALDTSQSTIANDDESVISLAPSTTTSVADSAFKQGLELLDADIARLQAQLRSSLRK